MAPSTTPHVAVISGGATGIGRATADALATDGYHVVLIGRREEKLRAAVGELHAAGASASWISGDASDAAAMARVAEHVAAAHDVIDAVVNNAGGGSAPHDGSLVGVAGAWRHVFEQNVMSAVLLTEALAPLLRRPGGRIVLVSSMAARSGGGSPEYAAAKAALHGWVLALTTRYARDGITANVVAPGYTPDTELFGDGLPAEIHDRIVSRIAVGRAGRSADVAAAIRYLVSPDASFVTSQVLEVSGGVMPPNL